MKKRLIAIIVIAATVVLLLIINSSHSKVNDLVKTTTETTIKTTTTTSSTTTTKTTTTTKKTTKTVKRKTTPIKSGTYKITHYGYDCKGCSGTTASGFNVRNTIYYNDPTYGKLRIVAMSSSIPLYSVIKIKNYKLGGDIYAIVLDRGVGSGVIDLLVESEKKASQLGIQKGVGIEILRTGKQK